MSLLILAKRLPQPIALRANDIFARLEKQDAARITGRREGFRRTRELKQRIGERRAVLAEFEAAARAGNMITASSNGWDDKSGKHLHKWKRDPRLNHARTEVALLERQLSEIESNGYTRQMTAAVFLEAVEKIPQGAQIIDAPTDVPLRKGETAGDALVRVRATIAEKLAERDAVALLPRTQTEQLLLAVDQVKAMARRGVPRINPLRTGGEIEWPKRKLPRGSSFAHEFVPDGAALVAFLFEAELTAKLKELIDHNGDDDAISAAEQRTALARLEADLSQSRREEASLVEQICAEGGKAFHFPEAPIDAVLGVKIGQANADDSDFG